MLSLYVLLLPEWENVVGTFLVNAYVELIGFNLPDVWNRSTEVVL